MARTKLDDLYAAVRVLNGMAGQERFGLSGAYGGWKLEYADGSKGFGGFDSKSACLDSIHRFIDGWSECEKASKITA